MSTFVISLMFSAGAGTWLYTKLVRRSGDGNGSQAIIVAVILTLIIFLVLYLTLHSFLD